MKNKAIDSGQSAQTDFRKKMNKRKWDPREF